MTTDPITLAVVNGWPLQGETLTLEMERLRRELRPGQVLAYGPEFGFVVADSGADLTPAYVPDDQDG